MTTYRGLWKIINSAGIVTDVQVIENIPGGNSLPIDVDTYINRGCEPTIESLPTETEFRNSKSN